MKDFNTEELVKYLMDEGVSGDDAASCLNENITFQMALDNGQIIPLFRVPFWMLVSLYKDVPSIETGEITEITKEDIHKIADGFKEFFDSGVINYNI